MKTNSSSLYSKFILSLYKVYELDNWPKNTTNDFMPKSLYSVQSKLQEIQTIVYHL